MNGRRTVTVPTLDHGPVTITCPAWCTVDHAAGPVQYWADVARTGLHLSLTVPSPHGPAEWPRTCVDVGPFSAYDRAVIVAVEVGGASARHTPASLRALADTLAAQLDDVRACADRIETTVTGWGGAVVNAGIPPEPGKSRLTISTYRLDGDGRPVGATEPTTYRPGTAAPVPVSLAWPACRCPRCRAGYGPRGLTKRADR